LMARRDEGGACENAPCTVKIAAMARPVNAKMIRRFTRSLP
jgi:hypothetical protein